MWADNETRIDLLGFDFLVDELLVILRDPRLLPVTVDVAGDWGSGKTSLICMAEEVLHADPKFLSVSFSPWRFEDYEDVKTALMAAVIGALQERARTDEPLPRTTRQFSSTHSAPKTPGSTTTKPSRSGWVRATPTPMRLSSSASAVASPSTSAGFAARSATRAHSDSGRLPVRLPGSRGEAAAVFGVQSDRVVRLQRP
jgi:hypothetical protein